MKRDIFSMIRSLALPLPALGLLFCASEKAPQHPAAAPTAEEMLRMPHGVKGTSLRDLGFDRAALHPDGSLAYLGGRLPAALSIDDPEGARQLLTQTLGEALRLAPGTDFQVRPGKADGTGYRSVRLRQLHRGVPVVHGDIILRVAEDGAVVAILGRAAPDLQIGVTPGLTGQAAIERALARQSARSVHVHGEPTLEIYAPEGAAPALVFRALVEYTGAQGPALEDLFADAGSGDVVAQHSHIHHKLQRYVYEVQPCSLGQSGLPGALIRKEGDGPSGNKQVDRMYDLLGATYWFYHQRFGRDSIDDDGLPLRATVNLTSGSSCAGFANAFYQGEPYNRVVFGTGDGQRFLNFADSADVTAHELTHGVTDKTSGLIYSGQSGGLNEAMSDIFGAGVEAWLAAGGSESKDPPITPDDKTWQIGDTIAGPALPGGALRFMNDPTKDSYSQDYYPEINNSEVHSTSGIANLAFYLLSQGGKHPRGKTAVEVTGVSMDRALRIFYVANTQLLTPGATFQAARFATAQAAEGLYGTCSAAWENTHKAWDAVGVPGAWTPCGSRDDSKAPEVGLSGIKDGDTVHGVVTLRAEASDEVGVSVVEFYRGTALLGVARSAPYSLAWDTTGDADGKQRVWALARDAAGNAGQSKVVTVLLGNLDRLPGKKQEEVEPNDTVATANRVLEPGVTVLGTGSREDDHFTVALPPGRVLRAVLVSPQRQDYDLYGLDATGAVVARSEQPVGVVDEVQLSNRGFRTLTRTLRVRGFVSGSNSRPYQLKLVW